ncbi:acyltransferase family protein [Chitinophaga sp.]|uniref:acyltransferase family protein n=1 Tax=Chitinophaga sp. TaxID=1869181 RepID=UPI002B764962|nr:heparan-alpha-glucosaminide N-acetyltransferase domain-containing protein [Chitinophaga sp.]HWV69284.1 heparan-alpha-glucosaminide N-acetyltransferase domain-containing protein [Chitinophaga sp.]
MKAVPERYLALDVLRGMTIAFMIIVNTPGNWSAIYAPLKHSDWNGCTVTDLVFPSFLFVVGNALSFSMRRLNTLSHRVFAGKVFRRTLIIFIIGVLLGVFPFVQFEEGHYVWRSLANTRLWGVLQRIAVCYCIAAFMIRYMSKRTLVISSVCILLLYWWVLYYFGTPPERYSMEGNAVGRLDRLYLSPGNIYKHYGYPFDPLGLLSTFPAVVNVIAGYLTGIFVQQHGKHRGGIIKLLLAGALMVVAGLVWDPFFPINKPLWTSSYVLYATGIVLLVLAVLIAVVEVWAFRKWTYFFEVFGKNPLFIYIIAAVVIVSLGIIRINGASVKGVIYREGFTSWLSPKNASLLFAVIYMLMIWLTGYVMDRRKIYVKV